MNASPVPPDSNSDGRPADAGQWLNDRDGGVSGSAFETAATAAASRDQRGLASAGSPARTGIIGILGGMGPAATVDLFDKIVKATPAACDQDHLRILVDNDPRVPDRTAALQGRGPDPVPALVACAQRLEAAGADFLVMPCHTAHAFADAIQAKIGIPLLRLPDEAASAIAAGYPAVRRVGLLATTGTLASGLYGAALRLRRLQALSPASEAQESLVMEAIYGRDGIKAGGPPAGPRRLLQRAAAGLVEQGAELILLACTELPLALRAEDVSVPLLDATDVLARAAVHRALA